MHKKSAQTSLTVETAQRKWQTFCFGWRTQLKLNTTAKANCSWISFIVWDDSLELKNIFFDVTAEVVLLFQYAYQQTKPTTYHNSNKNFY